jgi:glutaredoxin
MELNAAQRASVKRLARYRETPPRLWERIRLGTTAMVVMLPVYVLLGWLLVRLADSPGLVPLLAGLYLGALLREAGSQARFARWWPLTRELTDWDKVEKLAAAAQAAPQAPAAAPVPPPRTRVLRAVRIGVAAFTVIFAIVVGVDQFVVYRFNPARGNAPDHVVVLSASWCGYCMSLRKHLAEMQVPYTDLDVEETTEGRLAFAAVRGSGVPVTIVGQQVIRGVGRGEALWSKVDAALVQAGYPIPPKPRPRVQDSYYNPGQVPGSDWELFGLDFSKALVARDYGRAYAMTSAAFRAAHPPGWLQQRMAELTQASTAPLGPCRVEASLATPDSAELGTVYVDIGGGQGEALRPHIVREQGQLRVADLDLGRP